jgi:hypothetical protein
LFITPEFYFFPIAEKKLFLRMKKALILSALFFLLINVNGGTIPDSLITSWNNPGYQGEYPIPDHVASIMDFGGSADSSADNTAALNAAIASLNHNGGVICFPAGKFLFKHGIEMPANTILHGQGSKQTKLFFDLNRAGDFISAHGTITSVSTPVSGGYQKDSYSITVGSADNFSVGDYAIVKQDGSTLMDPNSTWAFPYFYQIVRIAGISGQTVTFEKPLRLTFQAALHPTFVKIIPVQNVGIECLSLQRLDTTPTQTYNIFFSVAANCWVKGVESHNANFGHVVLESSVHCTISGNYIHDAFKYGGGGQGYGIVLQLASAENFVYDNIMKHLRHCVLLQAAANGNVIAYNYSREQNWDELPHDAAGDIVLHGNYNFTNLIEGNICQNIVIDYSHGANGPYNTFFRNRAEYYGIIMSNGSGTKMNFVGNEITNSNFLLGNFALVGSNFLYGNNQHGINIPGGTTNLPETTLIGAPYASQIGYPNAINSKKNAAYTRWFASGEIKTVCNSGAYCDVPTGLKNNKAEFNMQIYPNPSSGNFTFSVRNASKENITLFIYDMNAQEIRSVELGNDYRIHQTVRLDDLAKGEYIAIIRTANDAAVSKLVIQ